MRCTPGKPAAPRPEGEREAEHDGGYTLVEMLVAICLMGTIVLSIMGGMWAVVRASSQNDARAKVQAVLGNAGDQIIGFNHVRCPEIEPETGYLLYAQRAAGAVNWPPSTVQIVDYKYWNPDANSGAGAWDDNNSYQSGTVCNPQSGFTPDKTLQKLTIQVTAPGSGYTGTIEIVKADIRATEVKDAS